MHMCPLLYEYKEVMPREADMGVYTLAASFATSVAYLFIIYQSSSNYNAVQFNFHALTLSVSHVFPHNGRQSS